MRKIKDWSQFLKATQSGSNSKAGAQVWPSPNSSLDPLQLPQSYLLPQSLEGFIPKSQAAPSPLALCLSQDWHVSIATVRSQGTLSRKLIWKKLKIVFSIVQRQDLSEINMVWTPHFKPPLSFPSSSSGKLSLTNDFWVLKDVGAMNWLTLGVLWMQRAGAQIQGWTIGGWGKYLMKEFCEKLNKGMK